MTTPGWVQEPMMLSRSTHDRAAHLRLDPAALAAAWDDPRAKVIRVHGGLAAFGSDGKELAYLTASQVNPAAARYFLGLDADGSPYFAADGPWEPAEGERAVGLRDISSSLGPTAAGLYVHALGLANWHVKHGFCAVCGSPTVIAAAGHVRQCPNCGSQHFPRYDPAVIMLVVDDDDRALFGHNPAWPPGRFSTLAGFVEPGESLEAAVIREVYEEVGVVIDDVSYEGSQPWPFPSSLMLGFRAHTCDPTLRIDAEEITEARWFSRDELVAAGKAREVLMPGSISIARWLVERWFGKPLPADNHW
ncbi:MAG TPA: NAD(+) diphosphatase [Sporichthyaceae bacterium]|jgi:NAD+ diphosphatase